MGRPVTYDFAGSAVASGDNGATTNGRG
jgi:hypothetical protein